MEKELTYPDKIRKLLNANTVMSLKQIRSELDNRPRSSLFRDLKKLNLITSFTHAGQYHALKSAVRFDVNGLWFFDQAGFAKQGTLKNTLIEVISSAQAGMTQKELKIMFRIPVQNSLTHLIKLETVKRHLLSKRLYLYLDKEQGKAAEQLQRRKAINNNAPDTILPAESLIIEILLELIHSPGHREEPQILSESLSKRGFEISDLVIAHVLSYYEIKKKQTSRS